FPALRPRERPAEEVPPGALRRPAVRLAGRGRAGPPGAPRTVLRPGRRAFHLTALEARPPLGLRFRLQLEVPHREHPRVLPHPLPPPALLRRRLPERGGPGAHARRPVYDPALRLGRGRQAPLLARDAHPSARRRIDEHLHPLPYPSQPRLRAHGPVLLRALVPAHVSRLDPPVSRDLSLPR